MQNDLFMYLEYMYSLPVMLKKKRELIVLLTLY